MTVRARKRNRSNLLLPPFPGGIQARARAKVGPNSVARLAWLLDLANRAESINIGSEQQRASLEAEVVAFSEPVGRATGGQHSQTPLKNLYQRVSALRDQIFAMLDRNASLELEI